MPITKNTHFQTPIEEVSSEKIATFDGEHALVFNKDTEKYVAWKKEKGFVPLDLDSTKSGWQDFADSATSITPIEQTEIGGGEIILTNDNGGTLTDGNTNLNDDTTLEGVTDTWDSASNTIQFNDTGLVANDNILYRIHVELSALIVPQDFRLIIEFFGEEDAGGSAVFSLEKDVQSFPSNAGVFTTRIIEGRYFLGQSIINGSARIKIKGSSAFECKVIGFNRLIIR